MPQAAASAPWRAGGVSVCGARHLAAQAPCQDALQFYNDERMAIVAVADGHGDPKYTTSDVGAQIAVDIAVELLMELSEELLVSSRPPHHLEDLLKVHFPQRIVWEWNLRVRRHAGHKDPDGAWHEDVTRYGTTLLGALITPRRALFFQLGDGDILLVGPQSKRIFELHDDIYGTVTHSLSQSGSARYARIRCLDLEEAQLMVLSSDGVSDCLQGEPDPYLDVGPWLLSRIHEGGFDTAVSDLAPWLSELSMRGNGDDATLGLIYWRPPT